MGLFYKPHDGWSGDFIPFFWNEEYHLFYIKDYRDEKRHGRGMSWFHIGTTDFINFRDYGEALPHGSEGDQDLYVFTGCAMEKDGRFHIFYTGHNPQNDGRPNQAVMHATSDDLIVWGKDPDLVIWPDTSRYEKNDWRDPFVFWNPDEEEYWMLLATRLKDGPVNRRGCIGLAASVDLTDWEIRAPFWAPSLYHTHECPDLFRWGDWWYLVYSTFSERFVTHYRMSRTLWGPWIAPANDTFDARAYYAAKTAGDGNRRFAFGWNPTREGSNDTGAWQWGGNLVVHEILQGVDGCLRVVAPSEIQRFFPKALPSHAAPRIGEWQLRGEEILGKRVDGFAWCQMGGMPDVCRLETNVTWKPGTRACGLVLRSDATLDHYYLVRLEPEGNRFVFDLWPRPGDQPFMLERPLGIPGDKSVTIEVLVDGSIMEIYIGDVTAMSTRAYDYEGGSWGLFVSEGEAAFSRSGISVKQREPCRSR